MSIGNAAAEDCGKLPLSVAIPTYGREQVLIDTIRYVLGQEPSASEILVLDQTPQHEEEIERQLNLLAREGEIRWLRLPVPSITRAMNTAICEAACPVVLFLDDDVIPAPGLIEAHWHNYTDETIWAVVGQVLQPGETVVEANREQYGTGIWADLEFPFNSTERRFVRNCIGCNLSVRRDRALAIGGIDENFVRVAYRFETEFCRRLWRAGGRTLFEPAAGIRHLHVKEGGTRSYLTFLRTHRPDHCVGDYYFALLHGWSMQTVFYMVHRLFRSLATYHLAKHPWWLPAKVAAEIRGLVWALRLAAQGQKLMEPHDLSLISCKAP